MAQYAHLSTPDPEWAAISAHIPEVKPIESIQVFREQVAAIRVMLNVIIADETKEGSKARVFEETISVEDVAIRVKAYIPDSREDESESFPMLFWMVGSGWTIGNIEDDELFLRHLAVTSRVVCVCPEYRKAPENPYPAAVNDCYAVLKWARVNASKLSIDVSKGVILGGLSAGGNLATVLAHRSIKDPELKGVVTGQILIMPCVISPHAYPEKFKSELLSMDQDTDKHSLMKQWVLTFSEAYHSGIHAANPEVSPALAESFEGLPPAYLQIAGLDQLRDEGFLYERLLREAGVATKLDVYPGLPHGFYLGFRDLTATKKQKKDFVEGLNWLLKSTK